MLDVDPSILYISKKTVKFDVIHLTPPGDNY